jgi:hypothetical protein
MEGPRAGYTGQDVPSARARYRLLGGLPSGGCTNIAASHEFEIQFDFVPVPAALDSNYPPGIRLAC